MIPQTLRYGSISMQAYDCYYNYICNHNVRGNNKDDSIKDIYGYDANINCDTNNIGNGIINSNNFDQSDEIDDIKLRPLRKPGDPWDARDIPKQPIS